MSSIIRPCKRFVAKAKSRTGHSFAYQCPVSKVDRKREGRTLIISDGAKSISFDGFGLRSLKALLRNVGEIGKKGVNTRRARVVVIEPR